MSAYLTWPEARDLALAGTPVRREGPPGLTGLPPTSPHWLEHRTGLWVLTDANHAVLRVVDAAWFARAEFYANDWTTDPFGTARDVCVIDSPTPYFLPPGIVLTGEPGVATISLHADIGASSPEGIFTVSFYLDGAFVGSIEAAASGRYTLAPPFDPSSYSAAARVRAWIDVTSSLPLPAWTGHSEWEMAFPAAATYVAIDLHAEFPAGSGHGGDWAYPWKTFGPYATDRWVYSHSADPVVADDDFGLNGVVIYPTGLTDPINGGATTLLLFLPAGQTFTLNIWNTTLGYLQYGAGGSLRLYNRPI